MIPPLRWNDAEGIVELLDQTRLPVEEDWRRIETVDEMAEAIRALRVRGAPAIGLAAAYGTVLALRRAPADPQRAVRDAIDVLRATRPTAVNLFYALNRQARVVDAHEHAPLETLRTALLEEAHAQFREDQESGRRLGDLGLRLVPAGGTVMTICHTGGVATSGYGTALATLILAQERGVPLKAFALETRPLLQGARITAWELARAGVDATLITDGMAAHVLATRGIDAVIVGADRIAANGDTANKIGTYGLAVLARHHGVPFYVSAPVSTIDLTTATGADIEIEERDRREITHGFGRQTAPDAVRVYNPAFDVTPAALITGIITERGLVSPPFAEGLQAVVTGA